MPFDSATFHREPADPVLRVLKTARYLVSTGWCQGALARNQAGQSVAFASPDAVAFCLAGATYRAGMEEPLGMMGALLMLMQRAEPNTVSDTNDRLLGSQGDAAAFLDRVIEARQAELANG